MDLDDRKLKILNAIVNDYILTAEPIGSRTIEKKYNLGVSAATIRNEMSDLEELGLLVAPHTSSGRVPSDKGFRLYVDKLIENDLSKNMETFQNMIAGNINKIENIMEETANIIAQYTNYATVVSEESFIVFKIKRVQIIPIDEDNILLVIVFDKNIVKNEYLKTDYCYPIEYFEKLTKALNIYLGGLLIEELTNEHIENIIMYVSQEFNLDNYIVKDIIENIIKQGSSKKDTKVYKSGVNNILEYPEFYNNASKVKDIFSVIEKNEFISNLLLEDESNTDKVKFEIVIGEENNIEEMKDLTVLKARYKISEDKYGNLVIICPKRMNYQQTISVFNSVVNDLNKDINN